MSVSSRVESSFVGGSTEPNKICCVVHSACQCKYLLSELVMTHSVTSLRPCHGRKPVMSAVCLQQRITKRTLRAQEFKCHPTWQSLEATNMECCLIHLMLPNQHVSVKPQVCHRESDGRRPETTSHAWSAIFAINRWSEANADSRLQNAARGKSWSSVGRKTTCFGRIVSPAAWNVLAKRVNYFFVMQTKSYFRNVVIWLIVFAMLTTPFFNRISFNSLQLYVTCPQRLFSVGFTTSLAVWLLISHCLCVKFQH